MRIRLEAPDIQTLVGKALVEGKTDREDVMRALADIPGVRFYRLDDVWDTTGPYKRYTSYTLDEVRTAVERRIPIL